MLDKRQQLLKKSSQLVILPLPSSG